MLAAPQGYVRHLGDAHGSKQHLAHRLSHYILRNGLLPTDALLLLHFSGWGVGGVGAPADPLAGTLDASGAWLLQLGLRWAQPQVLVPGLGPMLALRDYCAGLGEELCATVASALRPVRRRCEDPPLSLPALPPP